MKHPLLDVGRDAKNHHKGSTYRAVGHKYASKSSPLVRTSFKGVSTGEEGHDAEDGNYWTAVCFTNGVWILC